MAWSKKQKMIAVLACKSAGIGDEHRKLILRQFDNAMHDGKGKRQGDPSSTSRQLTNADFEQFMAIIERHANGQVKAGRQTYTKHDWLNKADDVCQRMRHLVERIADALERNGLLAQDGVGLDGWIRKYVVDDMQNPVTLAGRIGAGDLDYGSLHKLINGLRSFARRNAIEWEPAEPQEWAKVNTNQTPIEEPSTAL